MRIPLLLLCLALSPGCFMNRTFENQPISPEAVGALEPGTSTARDVTERLGAPSEIVQLGRRSAYRYDHTHSKSAGLWLGLVFLLGEETQQDRVWVFFDENDVLSHVASTFDADAAEYAIPPMQVGRE